MTGSSEPSGGSRPEDWDLGPGLSGAGLNLAGVLASVRYDALVPAGWRCSDLLPGARSVAVLGSGGPAFFEAAISHAKSRAKFHAKADAKEDGPVEPHPLDSFCESRVREEAERLAGAGWRTLPLFYWERRVGGGEDGQGHFADFVGLARAAGLGSPSRLGLLLHPEYGPWFGIRALLMTERELKLPARGGLETTGLPFAPCEGCPGPCIGACHGAAVPGGESSGGALPPFSHPDCAAARSRLSACRERCDARLACPIGRRHAYPPAELAHHMLAPFRGSFDG